MKSSKMQKSKPKETLDFINEFWNKTPGVYSGCSILMEKMKQCGFIDARYIEVLNHLGDCFDIFGKSMAKIGRMNPMEEDTGEFKKIGESLQNVIITISEECKETSLNLKDCARKTSTLASNMSDERKNIIKNMKGPKIEIVDLQKKMNSQQKNAKQRFKEMKDASLNKMSETKSENKYLSKDGSQNEEYSDKTKTMFNESEENYKESVNKFNEAIERYKEIAVKEFAKVQNLEMKRVKELQQNFLSVCKTFYNLSNCMAKKNYTMQMCSRSYDANLDILMWTAKNRTGQNAPSHAVYHPTNLDSINN